MDVFGQAQQIGYLPLGGQVQGRPGRSEAASTRSEHEAPRGRKKRTPQICLAAIRQRRVEAQARNDQHRYLAEMFPEIGHTLMDATLDARAFRVFLEEPARCARSGKIGTHGGAIDLPDSSPSGGVGDNKPMPALPVRTAGSLQSYAQTVLDEGQRNWSTKVEPFAHGASGGQDLVDPRLSGRRGCGSGPGHRWCCHRVIVAEDHALVELFGAWR